MFPHPISPWPALPVLACTQMTAVGEVVAHHLRSCSLGSPLLSSEIDTELGYHQLPFAQEGQSFPSD